MDCSTNPADTCRPIGKYNAHGDSTQSIQSYLEFLLRINDTSKYLVLPISDFATTYCPGKVVIGLRHDIDYSLTKALEFARFEHLTGLRSTYFILHTASYYLLDSNFKTIHNPKILDQLKILQDTLEEEIGWHNDLITLQVVYAANSHDFLKNELDWLRNNSINIQSSSAHGSHFCPVFHYLNWYFFHEFENDTLPGFSNNMFIPMGQDTITIMKGYETEYLLDNEAYHVEHNKYFSDVLRPDGSRWNVDDFNFDTLVPGDRVEILIHPIWWHNSDNYADFLAFNIDHQTKNTIINPFHHTIRIRMLPGAEHIQNPKFLTEQSVEVYIGSELQTSGVSDVDCSAPVHYTIHNKISGKNQSWTVYVMFTPAEGIINPQSLSDIKIAPNPAVSFLTIQNLKLFPNLNYKISNPAGQILESHMLELSGNDVRISVAGLPPGIYFLKLFTGTESRTITFIKQ